jgi:hypothetical protein
MNMKEMEQVVRTLQDALNGQGQAMTEMQAVITAQATQLARFQELSDCMDGMNDTLFGVKNEVERLQGWIGADEADGPFYPEFKSLTARVEELGAMIEGRNKSAPTKRNMTDADAIRVMTGDLKDASHKEAGEAAALTYAQVYSCRLEYTFKHVHKALKEANPEYKNKWSK